MKSYRGAASALFGALLLLAAPSIPVAAQGLVHDQPRQTTPLTTSSCLYADVWNGTSYTDRSVCTNWAAILGAVPLNGDAGVPAAIGLSNGTGLPIVGGTTGTLPLARGGTGTTAAGGTALDNISGFSGLGFIQRTGAASYSLLTPSQILDTFGSTRGSIPFRGAGGWSALLPGTVGYVLTSAGIGADPIWQPAPAGGGGGAATNGALGDIMTSNGAFGFGSPITPGSGVGAFLTNPAGAVQASWLASGAINSSLGFTPVPNTRTVGTSGLLNGGGALSSNLTISLSNIAANSLIGNPTGSTGAPTTIALGTNLSISGGVLNAATGVATAAGTNGQGQYNKAGSLFGFSFGTGLSLDTTNNILNNVSVTQNQSAADYTILAADASKTLLVGNHTYTLAQAGASGFGTGMGFCLLNTGSGNATVNTTTSTFVGAGAATSMTIPAGGWACPSSDGTNWPTILGLNSIGLAANQILIGGGAGTGPTPLGTLGTTATVLHANPSGAPTFAKVNLATDMTGNIAVANMDSGSGASSSTYFNGAGHWSTPSGAGTVSGPGSTVNGNIATWNGTTGTILADSGKALPAGTLADLTSSQVFSAKTFDCATSTCSNFPRTLTIGWLAGVNPTGAIVYTANSAVTLTSIRGSVEVATGTAATVQINKAPAATPCSSGTNLATGTFDANAGAASNQTLTVNTTGSANVLASGDRICLYSAATTAWTGGTGVGGLTIGVTVP